ncbi:MAG TPA: hypothetical protein VLZ28_03325 [Daejeonella sp.]|nr:hypothetical protein [Daejeonella sp.]
MSVQYLSNSKEQITGVQVQIEQWERIKRKYPDVDQIDSEVPEWHNEIIDSRLGAVKIEPGQVRPISDLFDELDR